MPLLRYAVRLEQITTPADNAGDFMLTAFPEGGWITWLENPGRENFGHGHWKRRDIGRWPAMHRIKIGHFTQK